MANETISSFAPANDEIELGKLLGILLDAKWLILGVTLLFTTIGFAIALLSPPIYKADALIQIEQKSSGGISAMVGGMGELFSTESSVATEIEIIKSRMILGSTVDKFNLTTIAEPKPNYLPFIGTEIARINGSQNSISVSTFDLPHTVQDLKHELLITDAQEGTFDLMVENQVVLSGVVGQIIEMHGYRIKVRELVAQKEDRFSISKISKLNAINRLASSLAIYERGVNTGIVFLSIEGSHPKHNQQVLNDVVQNYFLQNVQRNSAEAEQSLNFLKDHLPEFKEKLNHSENVLNRFRQENGSIDLNLEAQSTLKVVVALEAQLNELTFKESEISQKFTPDHPAYKSLLDKRNTLLQEKARWSRQVQKLPKTQREVLRMARNVEVNQQIYVQLLNKIQKLNIIKAGTVGSVRIIDSAQSYAAPVKPKKPLIVVLATLFGGMAAVAFVLVKTAFHRGITSPDEIEQAGIPIYASVPKSVQQLKVENKLKYKNKNNKDLFLLVEENPADLSIEALRGLRTRLHFIMMEAKNNIVMISGSAPSTGKTFVSTNLAAVVAKSNQKVLLIDADMRKGYIQQYFGLTANDGLSDFLNGSVSQDKIIKATKVDNLDVITRGQVPPNPSELLMPPRFKEFINTVSTKYDLVIIDTPPVLVVTDPSIVGTLAGTTLMVARFSETTQKEIEVAHSRFEQSGVEVKGAVLNMADTGVFEQSHQRQKCIE